MENIHLTLAFLGQADPQNAIAAARTVKGRRHELAIDAARYVKRNEMVWVGSAGVPEALLSLADELHRALRGAGFALEDRSFAAHVTLIRRARQPKSMPPLPAVVWPVDEFVLVSSKTSPRGSTYQALERFALH